MRRYWLPLKAFSEGQVLIEGESFKHICKVCRQGVASRFEVLNEHNKAYFVEVTEVGKREAYARILEERKLPELKKPRIHLALSIPKFQTVDYVLEKSVELGVEAVHLFQSDFSFIKAAEKDLSSKQSRWQRIIKGASQQTGRGRLMELTLGTPLRVLLEGLRERKATALLAYEGDGGRSMKQAISEISTDFEEVWVFVGSEGGFSAEDLHLFKNYEILPSSLGDQVLRVETACVTLVSILKYGLGQLD